MRYIPSLLLLTFLCYGCWLFEEQKFETSTLFHDYEIAADADRNVVTVLLRFRKVHEEGVGSRLPAGATISFDGETLKADSAGNSGVFYELQLELSDFAGTHTIAYTDASGKVAKDTFSLPAFSLADTADGIWSRDSFRIRLAAVPSDKEVLVTVSDSAFLSNDYSSPISLRGDVVYIPTEDLSEVSSGPLSVELKSEKDLPLTGEGRSGRLQIRQYIRLQGTLR